MTDPSAAHTGLPDDWIAKLRANDDHVLKALYAANYAKAEKYVLDNSGTEADAEDIYQEAFIAAWRNVQLDKVTFQSVDKFQGYLFRIVQYKWLDHLRTVKRQKTATPLVPVNDEEMVFMQQEEEDYLIKVKEGYASLGNPCKDILYRFYFLKQTMNQIAAAFSWTETTAKNNKYRCLQKLRNKIIPKKTTS